MAQGGDEKDDNPYSFKKFIKSKTNCRVSSDSDTEHSEEDGAVDLLENSCPLSRGAIIGVDTSDPGHFGPKSFQHHPTGAEVSGQFGTSAEMSRGHFGTGTELS